MKKWKLNIPDTQKPDLLFFFGAFDPPHNLHAVVIDWALKLLNPLRLDLILLNNHVLGKQLAGVYQRLDMLRIFSEQWGSKVGICTVDIEHNLSGSTFDSLVCLKKCYPNYKLGLLFGSDQLQNFSKWKNASLITKLASCFFVSRPGVGQLAEMPQNSWLLPPAPGSNIADVTSLKLKKWIYCDDLDRVRQSTMPGVSDYILANHLYSDFFEINPQLLEVA